MSGHSKWANIKHKKARSDLKRGKEFTKVAKEITLAARTGGGDLETNARLKLMVQKGKELNMPNENIARAIKKGTGELDSEILEELYYEGYAPSGVAVILEIATDNRNRTASDIRHLFSKYGGNLGETGCVSWMFDRVGLITIKNENIKMDPEEFLLMAIELGADDVREEEEIIEIVTPMEKFLQVQAKLAEIIALESADLVMLPQNNIEITDEEVVAKILKLVDVLDDHDDVQNVYANFAISDELMEKFY